MANNWTDEQQAIIAAAQRGESFVAEALAGTGKTTTLVAAVDRGLLCAFNASIRDELQARVAPGVHARTIHQLGNAAVCKAANGRPEVVSGKYRKLALAWLETRRRITDKDDQRVLADKIKSMVDMARLDLVDALDDDDALLQLARDREIDLGTPTDRRVVLDAIKPVIDMGMTMLASQIDYTDMLYAPIVKGMDVRQYPLVGVDECQDLSAAQLRVTQMAVMAFGQRIFIGDSHQAIYAFAGADGNSFRNVVASVNNNRYPMTISWRSPKILAAMAQSYVPDFRVPDNAIQGEYQRMGREQILRWIRPGMRVMCRVTADLIDFAFACLMEGKPTFVLGRDIAGKLKAVVDDVSRMPNFRMESFEEYLTAYYAAAAEALKNGADDDKAAAAEQALWDRVQSVRIIWRRSGQPGTPWALKAAIDAIIPENPDPRKMIECGTIHKNKGRENDVYVRLRPDLIPHPMAKTQVQREQEQNLAYVSLTRAKRLLVDEEC